MSNYDRFKPTPIAQTKERKQEVITITNEYDNDNGDKVKRMSIKKDGSYKIRVWPAHPIAGANSVEPKVVYFVPTMRKKKDSQGKFMTDANGKDILEPSVRPVFDARVHGESKYDLVDSFIAIAKKQAEALYPDNKDQQKDYLAPIVGNKFTGGTFMGISPIRSFLFYGELYKGDTDEKEFYEFEVGKAIDKGMQKTAAVENNNDPLGTDGCFTDIVDGRPMRIIVDSVAGKNDPGAWYSVSIVTEMEKMNVNGKLVSTVKQYPLSEEDLDKFEKDIEPLINYRKIFARRDLDIQLKGLEMFEETHTKFNIMDTEEFKNVYNYLDAKFPQTEESNQAAAEATSSEPAKQSEDELDLMDMKELKAYIKENGIGITVLPRYTDQDVREMIREIQGSDAEPAAEEENTADATSTEGAEAEPEAENTGKASNWKDRVQGLKNSVA